jgi:hypothetical protein
LLLITSALFLAARPAGAQVQWISVHSESFDGAGQLQNGTFGSGGWLTTTCRGNGYINLGGGQAQFVSPDFRDSTLLRITESLPDEYKIRVKLGQVHFNYQSYTSADFNAPDFKYDRTYAENGFYWLTLTDRQVEPTSGEDWWHRYRKIVIDSDDHTGERLPTYMVYMNPNLDRSSGDWTNGQANLLRCWSQGQYHTGPWDWEPAFHYAENSGYTVELEKYQHTLTMRVFDAGGAIIEQSNPVNLDLIYAMGSQASPLEYAYIGEPHIDSYEGYAYVDDIQLFLPGFTWVGGTSSNWGTSGNWTGNGSLPPNAVGAVAAFGNTGARAVVDLGAVNRTLGRIVFNDAVNTTISSTGGAILTLDNGDSAATIGVSGNQIISAPVVLKSDADISGTGSLALLGGISGNHVLTIESATTATTIQVNTLNVLSTLKASSIHADSLNIGRTATPQAVPEPSTIALLFAAAIGGLLLCRGLGFFKIRSGAMVHRFL